MCRQFRTVKPPFQTAAAFGLPAKPAREDVQILRAESCAVLTGIGTVLADNPKLNVRSFPTLRQPARIVLDSRLQIPLDCRLVTDTESPTVIVTLSSDEQRLQALSAFKHIRIISRLNTSTAASIFFHSCRNWQSLALAKSGRSRFNTCFSLPEG